MSKLKISFLLILTTLFGFCVGKINPPKTSSTTNLSFVKQNIQPEISIIQLQKIAGDELFVKISGPARVLWAEENLVENNGEFKIPLGQIPNENDLKMENFAFTANAKTKKFYPSSTYQARGTAVSDRRFFQSKEEAISAGFVASKLVK